MRAPLKIAKASWAPSSNIINYYYCYYYSSSGSDASPSGSVPGSRSASGPVVGSGSSEIKKYYNHWAVCYAPSKQETDNSAKKAMLETNKEKYK